MEFFILLAALAAIGSIIGGILTIICPSSYNVTMASKWILLLAPITSGASSMTSHYFVTESISPEAFTYGWVAGIWIITSYRLLSNEEIDMDSEQEQKEEATNT